MILLCWSLLAAAEPTADDHLRRGVELRKTGQDPAALEEFRLAYAPAHAPRAAAQMAFAEQALGRWVAAEAHLREALSATSDAWISAHKTELSEALATMGNHLGWVEILGGVPGAQLLLGDAVLATLPMSGPARVEVGTYPIEVRAAGYYPVIKPLTVTPGSLSRLEIALRPLAPPEAPPSAAPPPSSSPLGSAPPPLAASSLSSRSRSLGYSLLGLSVAGVVVGVAALIERNGAANRYNDDPSCPGTNAPSQPEGCQGRISIVHRWGWTAGIGFTGGGLAALGAGLLFWRTGSAAASAGDHSQGCSTGPGAIGLACAWLF